MGQEVNRDQATSVWPRPRPTGRPEVPGGLPHCPIHSFWGAWGRYRMRISSGCLVQMLGRGQVSASLPGQPWASPHLSRPHR